MGLTRNETIKLLAVVAVLDDRDTDDKLLIDAWHAMSIEGAWPSYEAAYRALLVYRSQQPDFPVRPGHITQVLTRVRSAASASFQKLALDPPDEALDDLTVLQAWKADRVKEHHARAMADFANGSVPPPRAIEGSQ